MHAIQRILLGFLLGFFLFSCEDAQKTEPAQEDPFSGQDTLVIKLEKEIKPKLALTTKALEATTNWTTYKTLQHNLSIKRDTMSIGFMKGLVAAMISGFGVTGRSRRCKCFCYSTIA